MDCAMKSYQNSFQYLFPNSSPIINLLIQLFNRDASQNIEQQIVHKKLVHHMSNSIKGSLYCWLMARKICPV